MKDEVILATWPQTGHKLVRVIGDADFSSRQTMTVAVQRRAVLIQRSQGEVAVLFVVGPNDKEVLEFIVELEGVNPDHTLRRASPMELARQGLESSIEGIYGYYLSFLPVLGFTVPSAQFIDPIDPGPIQVLFDVSSYVLLGVPVPWLLPLDRFIMWHRGETT